jgi:hypothetical protein
VKEKMETNKHCSAWELLGILVLFRWKLHLYPSATECVLLHTETEKNIPLLNSPFTLQMKYSCYLMVKHDFESNIINL